MKVAFIGLGSMGHPIATNIANARHELVVFNRTRKKAEEFAAAVKCQIADSPEAAVREADLVITMLADDRAVKQVVFGPQGLLGKLKPKAIHASMSTISVELSKKLTEAHKSIGERYVASPVFGRPSAAKEKKLWIVVGGAEKDFEDCQPVFKAISQGTSYIGPEPSMGNTVKLAGNFMIASVLGTLGEAFTLTTKAGIPATKFLETVNTALFKSPLYENYGTILATENFVPGFKLPLGLKDLTLAIEASDDLLSPMPLASLLKEEFVTAMARGYGDLDWSGFTRIIAENAGIAHWKKAG